MNGAASADPRSAVSRGDAKLDATSDRVALRELTEARCEVRPPWPYRLPRVSALNGLAPVRRGVWHRYLCDRAGDGVLVRAAMGSSGAVLFGVRSHSPAAARWALACSRRALAVDLDLRDFQRRFKDDPLIGGSVRRDPTLRVFGRLTAFEALACAITEQLIEFERACAIQRRLIRALGVRESDIGLFDFPTATRIAGAAPAMLAGAELSANRALTLRAAARLVAHGQLDLDSDDPELQAQDWSRLRRIPGIGAWTVEMLAVQGQGRLDQLAAGDLGYLKLVGRLRSGGDPHALASEQEVRDCFDPYGEWRALAAAHALASFWHQSPPKMISTRPHSIDSRGREVHG